MTFAEMRLETEILYESINSNAAPGFEDDEWGIILTAAQRRVVNRILREGIAKTAFNRLAIEALVFADSYSVFVDSDYYFNSDGTAAFTVDDFVDERFYWLLDEYVTTDDVRAPRVPLKTITFEEYQSNLTNPFRKPVLDSLEGFWVLTKDRVPTIITEGTVPILYRLVGVIHPDNYRIAPGMDCILNESVHSLIVMDAVKLAHMSVLDANGYQIAVAADSAQNTQ